MSSITAITMNAATVQDDRELKIEVAKIKFANWKNFKTHSREDRKGKSKGKEPATVSEIAIACPQSRSGKTVDRFLHCNSSLRAVMSSIMR